MDCREAERLVQLDLDGEIEGDEKVGLALHVAHCPPCRRTRDRVQWVHSGVKRRLAASVESAEAQPPDALRSRVLGELREAQPGPRGRGARIAAVLAVGVGLAVYGAAREGSEDPLLEDAVTRHASNLPPEVRASALDPGEVDLFLRRNLRFPVSVPELRDPAAQGGVRLVGARLAHLRDQDAAYVMYDHHGAKLSLFAAPEAPRGRAPEGFREHRLGDRTVLVGQRRGYNVVSWRDRERGMVYSLVSDVDQHQLLRLATHAGVGARTELR